MYSEELRKLAIFQRLKGETLKKISNNLNISISTVQTLINYKPKIQKQKRGPKCKITKAFATRIKRFVAKSNSCNSKVNANKIIAECLVPLKKRSMNNWLKKSGYKYRKVSQELCLTNKEKKNRVNIISRWLEENINWENSIFSDEKRFTLDGPDNWY